MAGDRAQLTADTLLISLDLALVSALTSDGCQWLGQSMPFTFELAPLIWLSAAACFGILSLILPFSFLRGFNTDIIVTGLLALGAKALASLLLLFAILEEALTLSSYPIVLSFFLFAAAFEFLAIIRVIKREWPLRASVVILLLGLGSLATAAVMLPSALLYKTSLTISASFVLIYTSIAALSIINRKSLRIAAEAILGLSLLAMSMIIVLTVVVQIFPDALPSTLNQISTQNLLIVFLLFAVSQSLSLVFIVRTKAQDEERDRRLRNTQTGVLNLEGFEQSSQKIRHMCGRLDQAVSLVVMQISDHNTLTHRLSKNESTQLLRNLVAITSFCLRKYDQIAQLDENYFVILMPFTDITRAQQACERLQKQLAVEMVIKEGENYLPVPVSMGVTDVPRAEEGVEAAIRRANTALQHAGANGIRLYPARRLDLKIAL